MDVQLVKPMSRLRIQGLISLYRAGGHMHSHKLDGYLADQQGTQVRVIMPAHASQLLDGEIVHIPDMTIRILPQALRFAVP